MIVQPPGPDEDPYPGLRFHPLSAEELPSSLELFGYGLYLRSIVRHPDSSISEEATRPTFGPCWPLEKVMFRTAQDFGSSDWEWLLRWHDFRGLGTCDDVSSRAAMVLEADVAHWADALLPGVLKGGV